MLSVSVFLVIALQTVHAQENQNPSDFGLKAVETGIGISPLGLTDENDLDTFIEYGGFITFITRNPGDFMIRFSASYGTSVSNPPQEYLSKGALNLTRFDAYLMYGRYFYGGIGIGYYLLDYQLSDDVTTAFANTGMSVEESLSNTLAYSVKLGVKSESRLGYFVEATVTILSPDITSSVVDLRTGNSATIKEPFKLRLTQFFQAGILYRL